MTDLGTRTRSTAPRLAAVLLAGTVLLAAGGLLHPVLPSGIPGELGMIVRTPHWRAIHLCMIAGTVLIIAGLRSRVLVAQPAARRTLVLILIVVTVGLVLNAVNVAFMAQMGTRDAALYARGDVDAAATFAGRHDAALLVARAGNWLVALACVALSVAEIADRTRPRWVAAIALVAGIAGVIGVVAFDPASRFGVTAVALFGVWAAASAVLALRNEPWKRAPKRRDAPHA